LLAIPTNQQAGLDLVAIGNEVEQENNQLLNMISEQIFCFLLEQEKQEHVQSWIDLLKN